MGMAKFADIEPFYDWLVELMRMDTSSYPDHETLMFYEIIDKLDSLPEVVRCRDCIHRQYVDFGDDIGAIGGCGLFDTPMMTCDDFCSYGERREGE